MNTSIFNDLSCYEELELKSAISGTSVKEVLKSLSNANNTFDDKIWIVIDGHFMWFSLKNGERITAPDKVNGDFDCRYCKSLTLRNGAPREVGRDFDCSQCTSLISLEGAPEKVGGSFYCFDIQI